MVAAPDVSTVLPADYFAVGDEVRVRVTPDGGASSTGVLGVPPLVDIRVALSPFDLVDAGAPGSTGDGGTTTDLLDAGDFADGVTRFIWRAVAMGEIEIYLSSVFAPDLFHGVSNADCTTLLSRGHVDIDINPVRGPISSARTSVAVYSLVRASTTPASPAVTLVARRLLRKLGTAGNP